jgi:putative hydrolase of the HAD superfamily
LILDTYGNAMRALRAIIFDLDNTLWDVGPVILRAEHAMLDFLAQQYPRVTARHGLESMRDIRMRMALEFPEKRHDFTWLRTEALRFHAQDAGYPESMAEEAFEEFFRVRNEVVLYEDARPVLEILSQRFRLFVISNGNADLQRIGIAHYFERCLGAREAGVLKPDPRIFQMLIEAAGLEAGEVAHVGDDPHADVEGARRAGVLPVWVNRGGSPWPLESAPPEIAITSLAHLPKVVEQAAHERG